MWDGRGGRRTGAMEEGRKEGRREGGVGARARAIGWSKGDGLEGKGQRKEQPAYGRATKRADKRTSQKGGHKRDETKGGEGRTERRRRGNMAPHKGTTKEQTEGQIQATGATGATVAKRAKCKRKERKMEKRKRKKVEKTKKRNRKKHLKSKRKSEIKKEIWENGKQWEK